jgi:hypothetical protein
MVGLAPYCASEGAFGVRFGPDPDFNGEITRWVYAPAFVPFDNIEVVRTRLSGIVHTINGIARYDASDIMAAMGEAERAYDDLRALIESSGAFSIREVTEYQARYDSVGRQGDIRIWLALSGSQVTLICKDVGYWPRVYEELPDDVRANAEETLRRIREREAARSEAPQ